MGGVGVVACGCVCVVCECSGVSVSASMCVVWCLCLCVCVCVCVPSSFTQSEMRYSRRRSSDARESRACLQQLLVCREVTFSQLEKRRRGKEKEERTLRSTNKTPKVTNHLLGTVKERDLPAHSSDKKHRKLSEVQKSVPIKEWHPLMEVGSLHEGQFWIMGNRSLISLNLSRNQIGEAGLRQLLEMIQVT